MARPRLIALVGDVPSRLPGLAPYLAAAGYDTVPVGSVTQCEGLLLRQGIDLVVLCPSDSDGGLDAVRVLRDAGDAAVLVVMAHGDTVDTIVGLETGADDVVSGPVEPQELAARIGGILARRSGLPRDILRLERTSVDLAASRLLRPGSRPERLGPGEVVLIRALTRHPRRVLSRDELMDLAPAESLEANDRSIDTRVARLRRKLDTEAIVTVRGHGYMYVPPFEAEQ